MDHALQTLNSRFAAQAWTAARRLASWPFRVAAAREAMRQLAGMSDHELADIRLTRQDIRDASALPLDEDPTRVLAMRVDERRLWQDRVARRR